jgi:hypothetical protein
MISQESAHALQDKLLDLVRGKPPTFRLDAISTSFQLRRTWLFLVCLGSQ